jgi:hypothetical protein
VILANDKLIEYYEDKIENINIDAATCNQNPKTNLHWTGSKVDLTELLYALHNAKVINNGNADIKELAINFGRILNIDIEEGVYRAYLDIKSRKTSKTKFLQSIAENLNQKMIDEDN